MEEVDISSQTQLIKKQPLFVQLTEEETKELALLFAPLKLKAGDTVVKQGDDVDSIYLIENGTADVSVRTMKEGVPVTNSVAILSSGEAIGLNETGFYSLSGKRTATVVAMTDMLLYKLSVAAFHGFALSHTHVSEIMHSHAEKNVEEDF
jgi:CRP-like cAMP-binding protein